MKRSSLTTARWHRLCGRRRHPGRYPRGGRAGVGERDPAGLRAAARTHQHGRKNRCRPALILDELARHLVASRRNAGTESSRCAGHCSPAAARTRDLAAEAPWRSDGSAHHHRWARPLPGPGCRPGRRVRTTPPGGRPTHRSRLQRPHRRLPPGRLRHQPASRVAPLLSRPFAFRMPDQTARVRPLSCAPVVAVQSGGTRWRRSGAGGWGKTPGVERRRSNVSGPHYQPDHCPAPQRCVSPRSSSQSPSSLDCRVPNTSLVGPQPAIRSI
jgi:hypothetical protein